jgi:hypothetical protein
MYMISMETVKTCAQGALGAITFGAYHMYVTKSMMEVNNEVNHKENLLTRTQNKYDNDLLAIKNQMLEKEMKELKSRLDKRWF